MTNYQLTEWQNQLAEEVAQIIRVESNKTAACVLGERIVSLVSKKARNETNREWIAWLKACGLEVLQWVRPEGTDCDFIGRINAPDSCGYFPSDDDPNRFRPKDI